MLGSKVAFSLYSTFLHLLHPQDSKGTLSLCSHSPWLKKPWLGETAQKSLGRLSASHVLRPGRRPHP